MNDDDKRRKYCTFCGLDEAAGPMSMEHFVPKCLWAGPRPRLTRTVPAHVACNNAFAEDNEYFRTVIAFDDVVRAHPEAQKVIAGPVSRLMTRRPGQFLRQAKDYSLRPRTTETGLYLGFQPCFSIDFQRIDRVVSNVVRGLFHVLIGKPLAQDRIIRNWLVGDLLTETERYFADRMCNWQGFGDDVFLCRYAFCDNREDIVCFTAFYHKKLFFSITHNK